RSAVRSRPPLPIKSTTYSGQQHWPLIVCGRIVADARANDSSGFNSSTLAMFGRVGVAKSHLDRGVAHQLSDRGLGVSSVTELRAKRMPEVMPTEIADSGKTAGSLKCTLDLGELFSCCRVNKNVFTLSCDSPKSKQFFA